MPQSARSPRTLTVNIARPTEEVFRFVRDARNLPLWADGLCRSVREHEGEWLIETPLGEAKLRFVPQNDFGVLDHYVLLAGAPEVYVPLRVVASGNESHLVFTLLRVPGMTDEQFAADAAAVERDLLALKTVLEAGS